MLVNITFGLKDHSFHRGFCFIFTSLWITEEYWGSTVVCKWLFFFFLKKKKCFPSFQIVKLSNCQIGLSAAVSKELKHFLVLCKEQAELVIWYRCVMIAEWGLVSDGWRCKPHLFAIWFFFLLFFSVPWTRLPPNLAPLGVDTWSSEPLSCS